MAAVENERAPSATPPPITVGADRWDEVLARTHGRRLGLVVNHTSRSGDRHLVDRLLAAGVPVTRVFAPEHGFRGAASDGEHVADHTDARTGLPIASLYGRTKRPTAAMLADVDLLVFDIQDVGTRFYTYISTMHYVMDAAAEFGVPVLVLDRPNPNGHYVDGPVLDTASLRSFIGMHPIPSAHGLTVGELARMINGEGWLSGGRRADLDVVPVANYRVGERYDLPVAPSPNLPTARSVALYPTLCHFEGTVATVGRGTDLPFQLVGHPALGGEVDTVVTPAARPGAKYAKLRGEACRALTERSLPLKAMYAGIDYSLLDSVAARTAAQPFVDRPEHFDRVAGTDAFRLALRDGRSLAAVNAGFAARREAYKRQACPYLLYARSGLDWGAGSAFCGE